MFSKIDKINLTDKITRQMISKVTSGFLKPGDKLPPEREMAEQMAVNRHTLREALRKLEMLELVSARQGDGIYVLDYRDSGSIDLLKHILVSTKERTSEIIHDLLRIRTIVIPEMAATSAEKVTSEEINNIKNLLEDPSKSIIDRDFAIHNFIARTSGNIFFNILLNFFNEIFRPHAAVYFSYDENINSSSRFHKNIIDALKRKDSRNAFSVLQKYKWL